MSKQNKITRSAIGQTCTLRLVLGKCSGDDTVVLAHLGLKRGMSSKSHDIHACYACHACHLIEEDKSDERCTWQDRFRALEETQLIMIAKGLIRVEGQKSVGWLL